MTNRGSGTKKSSEKTRAQRDAEEAAAEAARDRQQRIAEAAYYAAERRGFEGNLEVEDWLEAERAIDAAAAGIQHEEDRRSAANGEMIEPDRVAQWAKKLKVPAPRLREAIARVGPVVDEVKQFLKSERARK
jgi:DUF2934 family protein/uncharacterized protein DUF3606